MEFFEKFTTQEAIETDFIGLSIQSNEVKHMNFNRTDQIMKTLVEAGKLASNKVYWSFEGYDDVPTEIYEIPAIRKWVHRFSKKYPYFLYFIEKDITDSYVPLLACLCDVQSVYLGEKLSPIEQFDNDINPFNAPKQMLQLTMVKEWKERLVFETKSLCEKLNDKEEFERLSIYFEQINTK